MGDWLLDTSVLLRMHDEESSLSEEAANAVISLLENETVYITPQVLIEFWCVATRPIEVNGFGLDTNTVADIVGGFRRRLALLDDSPDVFDSWIDLVARYQRRGKQVHDARIVAVMKTHGTENLLTFNVEDFAVYREINAVHPRDVNLRTQW